MQLDVEVSPPAFGTLIKHYDAMSDLDECLGSQQNLLGVHEHRLLPKILYVN